MLESSVPVPFTKNEALEQVFSCEFCEISKNKFLKNTSGRLLLDVTNFFNKQASKSITLKIKKKSLSCVHDVNLTYAKTCLSSHINPLQRSQSQWLFSFIFSNALIVTYSFVLVMFHLFFKKLLNHIFFRNHFFLLIMKII